MAMNGLNAARRSHEVTQRKNAERDPLVAAVLARFPGAEIVEVRQEDRTSAKNAQVRSCR